MCNQTNLLSDDNKEVRPFSVESEESVDEKLCSFSSTDLEELYSSYTFDTRGDRNTTTSERYVKILDFRHFVRQFMFAQGD